MMCAHVEKWAPCSPGAALFIRVDEVLFNKQLFIFRQF